jgi:anaerobic nitric oxide reductase flavorubredoxin
LVIGCLAASKNILSSVGGWLEFLKELKFRNKKAAVFGCYGWSGESTKVLRERLEDAGFAFVEPEIKCHWNPTEDNFSKAYDIAKALCSGE